MSLSDYVVFLNTDDDCAVLARHHATASAARVSLHRADGLVRSVENVPLWLDPSLDGLPGAHPDTDWYKALSEFAGFENFADEDFVAKPSPGDVRQFIKDVLDACLAHKPAWLSVPQLAQADSTAHNKVNKALATEAGAYLAKRFRGKVILPAVFTNQRQLNNKTARTAKLASIQKCAAAAGAHAVWLVDSSLGDQSAAGTFVETRFPGVICMHQEVAAAMPHLSTIVAGPYWGLNLVLWARSLATSPAIGAGSAYQYYPPGRPLRSGVARLALGPLRRWARADANLKTWLVDVAKTFASTDPARKTFQDLATNFGPYTRDKGRNQIAEFYERWFRSLASVAPGGRTLALYQDFSAAYVLGSGLPAIPSESGQAGQPGLPARQFMLNCL